MAGASNAEDPSQDAPEPGPRAGARRTVRKTFRVSAVWRPAPREGEGAAHPDEPARPAGVRLSDEEVVYGLINERARFEQRALADARVVDPGVESVTLEDVRPARSVAAQIAFVVRVSGNAVAAVAGLAAPVMAGAAEALESAYGQPVAVSAVPESVGGTAAATAAPASGWDRVAPVLGAIGTGVGIIGFVTFVGGVTVYARLRAAGFPAAPALGIFPSQDLVVIGAQTLVPEALWGLVSVILLVLLYTALRAASKRVTDEEAALLAGHATRLAAFGMFVFVALALVVSTLPFLDELDDKHRALALLLVVVAASLAATAGSVTRRFVYLATTTFVLVGVFLSFTAYWRESNATGVRGAAIVRDNKKAVVGIFVAEGSGRVYLARVNLANEAACERAAGDDAGCSIIDNRSRLVGIAKDQVSDIALGDPKPPWLALQQGRSLARELCDLQVRRPAQGC